MADDATAWMYRVSTLQFSESNENQHKLVDKNMALWADEGWELVSASTSVFSVHMVATPYVHYSMYWKKRKG